MVCLDPQTDVCHKSSITIPKKTDECYDRPTSGSRSSCKVLSYLSSIDKVIPRILATAAVMGGMPIGTEEWAILETHMHSSTYEKAICRPPGASGYLG